MATAIANFNTANQRKIVRTSGGNIYVINNDYTVEMWKSTDGGSSFSSVDSFDGGYTGTITIAIDSSGIIHCVARYYKSSAPAVYKYQYFTFDTSTDNFSAVVDLDSYGGGVLGSSIAVDSNNIPHIAFCGNPGGKTAYDTVYYKNKVGGSWNTAVQVEGYSGSKNCLYANISINASNIPVISYLNGTDGDLGRAVGNANNATSFTLTDLDTAMLSNSTTSICIDSSGNYWVAGVDSDNTIIVYNGTTACDTGATGTVPSIVANGTDIYVFYENSTDDIVYQKWNGSSWDSAVTLETGTYSIVNAKWSYYNNNGGTTQIDYLFYDSVGYTAYWNKLTLSAEPPPASTFLPRMGLLGVG